MCIFSALYRYKNISEHIFLFQFELSSMLHYNDRCISLNTEVIGIFGRFRFGWDFLSDPDLGDFDPLTQNLTLRILKRDILTPNEVF